MGYFKLRLDKPLIREEFCGTRFDWRLFDIFGLLGWTGQPENLWYLPDPQDPYTAYFYYSDTPVARVEDLGLCFATAEVSLLPPELQSLAHRGPAFLDVPPSSAESLERPEPSEWR